jgi:hypothetical protein
MCMVVYIASRSPLPLIPWQKEAPAFNVSELTEHEQPVRSHFAVPYICQAGSHTCCGCGFNEGREYPQAYDDPVTKRADAMKSSAQLVKYVREHHIEQIYSCWSGDESQPKESECHIKLGALVAEDFFFRERQLLIVDQDTA